MFANDCSNSSLNPVDPQSTWALYSQMLPFIFSEAPPGRGWHGILMRLAKREPTNSVAGMDAVSCWPLKNSEPRSRSAARPVGAPEMVAGHRAAVVQPSVTTNRVTITRICHSRVTYIVAATTRAPSITVVNDSVDAGVSRASITTNVVK